MIACKAPTEIVGETGTTFQMSKIVQKNGRALPNFTSGVFQGISGADALQVRGSSKDCAGQTFYSDSTFGPLSPTSVVARRSSRRSPHREPNPAGRIYGWRRLRRGLGWLARARHSRVRVWAHDHASVCARPVASLRPLTSRGRRRGLGRGDEALVAVCAVSAGGADAEVGLQGHEGWSEGRRRRIDEGGCPIALGRRR